MPLLAGRGGFHEAVEACGTLELFSMPLHTFG